MSRERLSGKPFPDTRSESRYGGRVFHQTPEHSKERGLKRLNKRRDGKGQPLLDLSAAPSLISGITEDEVDTIFEASNISPECSLPEGGYRIVGKQHFSQTGRVDRAEEGY